MRHHRSPRNDPWQDPWKWPVTGLAVALLLVGVFLVPHHWIDSFFSPLDLSDLEDQDGPARWMTLLPPPAVQVARPEDPPTIEKNDQRRPPREDPRWWSDGWSVRQGSLAAQDLSSAAPDSAEQLLAALGLGEDFMTRVKPDSVLVSRLLILKQEDSFRFDELKPYFEAVARSRDYADIMSRASDMYGEHLGSQVMVPD